MRKLKIEDLKVDSFVTGGDKNVGTVGAHQEPYATEACEDPNSPRYSQDLPCSNTAGDDACGNTACQSCLTYGYTCDRPSCAYTCHTKYTQCIME